jgi:hypothetical protein
VEIVRNFRQDPAKKTENQPRHQQSASPLQRQVYPVPAPHLPTPRPNHSSQTFGAQQPAIVLTGAFPTEEPLATRTTNRRFAFRMMPTPLEVEGVHADRLDTVRPLPKPE